jgi:hypothetical protein
MLKPKREVRGLVQARFARSVSGEVGVGRDLLAQSVVRCASLSKAGHARRSGLSEIGVMYLDAPRSGVARPGSYYYIFSRSPQVGALRIDSP